MQNVKSIFFGKLFSKIKSPKQKILITILYISVVALMYIFKAECIFIRFLNIPCPGCGMTRALLSALSFDFISAFKYNAMFWALPIMYIYFLCDGRVFKNKRIDFAIWFIILSGFVINWIIHLILTL